MAKVGILTINDDRNYGNRLQNYAVQEVLKKHGFIVETIHNKKGVVGINVIKRKIIIIIKRILFVIKKCQRFNAFMRFNKNIRFSNCYIDEKHCPSSLNKKYDFFFTGSDQVWNPNFGRISDIDFLCFADKKKRNSISASFGISSIPKDMKEYYASRLNVMNKISVREEKGKKIIEELTGRKDIQVLVDPTMLLTEEEWNKVSKIPKKMKQKSNERYILNYFLGNLSQKRKQIIEKFARDNNCKIINLLAEKDPFYVCGPSEFLWLEKNAFLICTDSFHSSVFAILYNTPFIVFDREDKKENMNSRIDTLLSKFKLEDRRFNGKNITKENLKHDYTESYKILDKERKKSEEFLKKALDIE